MKRPEALARIVTILISLGIIAAPLGIYASSRSNVLHARVAEEGGWTPQTISARAGEPFTLHITSDDVIHGFGIGQSDLPYADVEPGKITDITVIFDKPGVYTFFCTRWCGLNHWRMRGTIEVSGEGSEATQASNPPLYVSLGIDIDAPHLAVSRPERIPSARPGRQLASGNTALQRLLNSDYYRSHSPDQVYSELQSTALTPAQKWDLVAYIWRSNTTPQGLEEGRKLYTENCAACHGESGAGDGVFAQELAATGSASGQGMSGAADMSMQRPADFTDPERMLGASPALLQGKLLRGGMGTGMPMWGAIFTDQQTWDIIAYLYSLQFDYQH